MMSSARGERPPLNGGNPSDRTADVTRSSAFGVAGV